MEYIWNIASKNMINENDVNKMLEPDKIEPFIYKLTNDTIRNMVLI